MADLTDADIVGGPSAPSQSSAPSAATTNPFPNDPAGLERDASGNIIGVPFPGMAETVAKFGQGVTASAADPESIARYLSAHPEVSRTPPAQKPNAPAQGQLSDADIVGESAAPSTAQPTKIEQAASQLAQSINPQARAAVQGALFGFEPDAAGAAAYVSTAIGNALDRAQGKTPQYGAEEAYKAVSQSERGQQQRFAQEHPVQTALLGIGGSFLNPLTYAGGEFIGAAPTIGSAVGRSALVGGGQGALQGIGEAGGGLFNRLQGAAEGGALGTIGGGVLGGATKGLSSLAKPDISGSLNQAFDALKRTGIDPSQLPRETTDLLRRHLASGANPEDAAFDAVSRTLPGGGVPISAGQMSADAALQRTENLAATGGSGAAAATISKGFREDQTSKLRGALEAAGQQIAGGRNVQSGEAGVGISSRLNEARNRASNVVNEAYEAARQAPTTALAPSAAQDLANHVRYGLEQNYHPSNIPRVTKELRSIEAQIAGSHPQISGPSQVLGADLSKFSPQARAAIESATGGTARAGQDAAGTARNIFAARQRLTKLGQSADPVEAGAAKQAVRHLDTAIDEAMSKDLFSGDPAAVSMWKKAIGARRDFGKLFEGDDLIEKLTERTERGGESGTLKLDPIEATNYILGKQGVEGLGRQNTTRDLTRLKGVLGGHSEDWNSLKGEAFNRLVVKGAGPSEAGQQGFSGSKFLSNWRAAEKKYGPVLDTLFSPEERQLITRLAVISERITKPVAGGSNPSGTAHMLNHIAKGMGLTHAAAGGLGHVIGVVPLVKNLQQALRDQAAARTITKATVNAVPREIPAFPGSSLPTTGALSTLNQGQRSAFEEAGGP